MSWEFIVMAIVVVIGMAFAFVAGMYTEWLQDKDSRDDFLHAESAAFKDAVRELAKEGDDNVGGD